MTTKWAWGDEFQGMERVVEKILLQNMTLPGWVNWLAQDADGTWWAFEIEPLMHDQGWYENEIGRCVRLVQEQANRDWELTLMRYHSEQQQI